MHTDFPDLGILIFDLPLVNEKMDSFVDRTPDRSQAASRGDYAKQRTSHLPLYGVSAMLTAFAMTYHPTVENRFIVKPRRRQPFMDGAAFSKEGNGVTHLSKIHTPFWTPINARLRFSVI